MRAESIILVLQDLNSDQRNGFYLETLSESVDFGIFDSIIESKATYGKAPNRNYHFYLVKDDTGKYIAAVYVMSEDMHWVVLPENRRKGVLIKPLTEVIIPHLFNEQDEIKISIDRQLGDEHFEASDRIALKAGFVKFKDERDIAEYRICKGCTSFVPQLTETHTG